MRLSCTVGRLAERMPKEPRAELLVALAGPAVNMGPDVIGELMLVHSVTDGPRHRRLP